MERAKPLTVAVGQFAAITSLGLRQILSEDRGLDVVGTELDGAELQMAVERRAPRVVILDEARAAAPLLRRLCAVSPRIGLLVLAHQPTRAYGVRLLAYGASACLSTEVPPETILSTIRLAADGTQAFASTTDGSTRRSRLVGIASLTPRERQVLTLLGRGESNARIALELQISIETARSHVARIYRKLGVSVRGELLGIELSL